ncbi:MAG TPA: 3-phosphoshikimate 1-carboxyvinyltransferase [Mesotoga infera]|nr:3-phosphoshikimate 1-carboxyvinyltransferase [Mesotoga infera]
MKILPVKKVRAEMEVPPDKSISHRSLILSSMAEGRSIVHNLLESGDTLSTLRVMKEIGARFSGDFERMEIMPALWKEAVRPLDCGNSGTTARIISGLLAGTSGLHILFGDESLSRRPMKRVIEPLKRMGASIFARNNDSLLPLSIKGGDLHGCTHDLQVASAQVKSAILLAGMKAEGITTVIEPVPSRDHTERMLDSMGAKMKINGRIVSIERGELNPVFFQIPGDVSSASFFLVLAILHPDASIIVRNVGLNERRTGLLKTLKKMGAEIEWTVEKTSPEPCGKIVAKSSRLTGLEIDTGLVPSMIDEIPLLALAGAKACGTTVIRGAGELRKKESDRITSTVENFRKLGVVIEELEDGFSIEGSQKIVGGRIDSAGDHRIAMLFAVAGILSEEGIEIGGADSVRISYPQFFKDIAEVCR